jgi:fermentation-respiration switch protein FrsA (DUF1100 family)
MQFASARSDANNVPSSHAMILDISHKLLIALYLALPPAAVIADLIRARRAKASSPSGSLVLSIFIAIPLGVIVPLLYAYAMGGKLRLTQLPLAIYFAAGLMLLLRAFDALLRVPGALIARRENSRPTLEIVAGAARIVILLAVGLPYVLIAALSYRPKLITGADPMRAMSCSFDQISFVTSDQYHIAGWWIPAEARSDRTVLVCHGMTGDKSRQLFLARPFISRGYNVLIFDFRAHGDSDGQLSSFGDLERRDVLAAVKWLLEAHPRQAAKIYGVGVDSGGAALIAAAADPSAEGQAINAVAVYGAYDSLPAEFQSIIHTRFAQPLRWLLAHLGLPLANVQLGADVAHFEPWRYAQQIWPRPIMVIHGVRDQWVDFDRGSNLYEQTSHPKRRLWVSDEGHDQVIKDRDVGRRVREFFDSAEAIPVI